MIFGITPFFLVDIVDPQHKINVFDFDKQMNDFIWQSKKPCLSFFLMTRQPSLGGMDLLNLRVYHFAVTLDQVKYWRSLLSDSFPSLSYSLVSIPLEFANLHNPELYAASWKDKDLAMLEDLYNGSRFRTFADLQNQFDLLPIDYYKLMQIEHLVKKKKTLLNRAQSLLICCLY